MGETPKSICYDAAARDLDVIETFEEKMRHALRDGGAIEDRAQETLGWR